MKYFILLFVCFIVTGCVSQAKVKVGNIQAQPLFEPNINEVSKVSLGERMMYQAVGWSVDCISPNLTKKDTFSLGMYNFEIIANRKMCGDSVGTNKYIPNYPVVTPGEFNYSVVEVIKDDGSSDLCMSGYTSYCLNYQSNEISRGSKFKSAMNSLQQSIEYMGSDGNNIKFLYTEFQDGMARTAFNREFTVDLTKGNTLNFKGATVEILDVTNTSLEYKVVKYFN